MHLQGKDLVSQATQRSARALVATALVVVLAKHYAVLPAEDLELVGVKIGQTAVSGGIFWVVLFQSINHLIHWVGDFHSIRSWNSKEKVNGPSLYSAGSHILSKLDKTINSIEDFLEERSQDTKPEGNYPDLISKQLENILEQVSDIRPSVKSYRTFGAFYFFGWFFIFPLLLAVAAILWP